MNKFLVFAADSMYDEIEPIGRAVASMALAEALCEELERLKYRVTIYDLDRGEFID